MLYQSINAYDISSNECKYIMSERFLHQFEETSQNPTQSALALLKAIGPKLNIEQTSIEMKLIGKGFFAKVYKIQCVKSNRTMAFKIPRSTENINKFMKEIIFLKRISHRSILKFYGTTVINGSFGYLTEYLNNGNLSKFIVTYKQTLKWTLIVEIAHDISSGLKYLHSEDLLHRDLSSENILLEQTNENIRAIIGDFGLSIDLKSPNSRKITCVGNPFYAAPEHLNRTHSYSYSSDMFSFGLLLCELITGYKNEHPDIPRTNNFGVDYELLPVRRDCPKWLQNLACDCCKVHIQQRPSSEMAFTIITRNKPYISLWNQPRVQNGVNCLSHNAYVNNNLRDNNKIHLNNSLDGYMALKSLRNNRAMSVVTPIKKQFTQPMDQPISPLIPLSTCTDEIFSNNSLIPSLNTLKHSTTLPIGLVSPVLRRYNSLDNFLEPHNFSLVKAREDPHYTNLPLSPQSANKLASSSLLSESDPAISMSPSTLQSMKLESFISSPPPPPQPAAAQITPNSTNLKIQKFIFMDKF